MVTGDACNGGADCVYPCEELGTAIITGYAAYLVMMAVDRFGCRLSDAGYVMPNLGVCRRRT